MNKLDWLKTKLSVEDWQRMASVHNAIVIRVRRESKAEAMAWASKPSRTGAEVKKEIARLKADLKAEG